MFEIKKNFPLPTRKKRQPTKDTAWPFKDMEVNDCAVFSKDADPATLRVARAYYCIYGKRHNKKFKCKTIDGQLHVWRIE